MRKLFLVLLLFVPIAVAQYAYDTVPSYDDKSQYSKEQYDQSQYDTGQYDKSAEKYVPLTEPRRCIEGATQCSKGEWLACRDNNWIVLQRCAANERCDARAGCIAIPTVQEISLPPPTAPSLPEGVSRLSCGRWPEGFYYAHVELPSDIPFNESRGDCVLVGRNESVDFYLRNVEEHIRRCRELNRADFERARRYISNISTQIPRLRIPVRGEAGYRMPEPCLADLSRSSVSLWRPSSSNYSEWRGRELTRRLGTINYHAGGICNTGASLSYIAWEGCHGVDSILECGIIDPLFAEFISNTSRDIQLKYDSYENGFNELEREIGEFRTRFNPDALRVSCEGAGVNVFSRFVTWIRGLFGF